MVVDETGFQEFEVLSPDLLGELFGDSGGGGGGGVLLRLDEGGERGGDFVDALVEEQVGVLVLVLEVIDFIEVLVSAYFLAPETLCF